MKTLAFALVLVSMGAHAIPPAPPTVIVNKIKSSIAKSCTTNEGGITVSDLKDTEQVKFVLQLDSKNEKGVLSVLENGKLSQNFDVTCKQ